MFSEDEVALTLEQIEAHNSILFKIRCDICHDSILVLTSQERTWTVMEIVAELKQKKADYSATEEGIRFLTCRGCTKKMEVRTNNAVSFVKSRVGVL